MKINELEDLLGVSRATIRYYEDQGLVTPPRTENGYRDYSYEEARLFQKIMVLRKLGVSVPEIKDLIEDKAELHDVLSPKYLKTIYESEQKGTHFAEAKEMSPRELNLAITLIGAMAGFAIPQNNRYSRNANSPIPADIRANAKEGEEYYTIGDMLKKGGIRKAVVIIAAVLAAALLLIHGLAFWGETFGVDIFSMG